MNAPVDPVYLRRAAEPETVAALRRRIMKAGERCLSRAERANSYDVGNFMLRAAQIANVWQWAVATEAQLEDVLALLTALNIASNAAERLETPDA